MGSEVGLGVKSLHLRGLHLLSSYPRRHERTTESYHHLSWTMTSMKMPFPMGYDPTLLGYGDVLPHLSKALRFSPIVPLCDPRRSALLTWVLGAGAASRCCQKRQPHALWPKCCRGIGCWEPSRSTLAVVIPKPCLEGSVWSSQVW